VARVSLSAFLRRLIGSTVTHEEHRYPFAGAQNPKVKLGVVSTTSTSEAESSDKVLWFDLHHQVFRDDFYLAKVEWLNNENDDDESTKIVVQLLDRRQQNLALLLLDAVTGTVTTLHLEKAMEGIIYLGITCRHCFQQDPRSDGNLSISRSGTIMEFSTTTWTTRTTLTPLLMLSSIFGERPY
jgi:hypothetical protein